MKCKITIVNRAETERLESLGMDGEPATDLTDFWVRNELIESFWIDKYDNEIVFSVNGSDYRTEYTMALFNQFKSII